MDAIKNIGHLLAEYNIYLRSLLDVISCALYLNFLRVLDF